VADIAQAMAQDRPYRSALGPQDLSAFLGSLAYRGEIDAEVARVALSDIGTVLQAARVAA
jgi:HD-GYP domain-containing protein (c-di-GMP phosphodiesterase class II)